MNKIGTIRTLTTLCIFIITCLSIKGEIKDMEVNLNFRVNTTLIDSTYLDNAFQLRNITNALTNLKKDTLSSITKVTFYGTASPEGSYELNKYLARERCRAIERYIRKSIDLNTDNISYLDNYIPWNYLREKVSRSASSYRDEVLEIIDETPQLISYHRDNLKIDHRVVKLQRLQGGSVWKDLYNKYFKEMRNASAIISVLYRQPKFDIDASQLSTSLSTDLNNITPITHISPLNFPTKEFKPFYMAAKTNMLYDALLIPNIGLEFYLGKKWSILGDWMYSWWKNDHVHNYWRVYGGDIELRKWLGNKKPLQGHHIGLYAQIITYDFELGGRGYLGDRWTYGGGIAYGYSMPIARHFNIDFTLGVGYMRGEYKEYLPQDGHYVWQCTKMRNWIGPTRAEVSLVWLLGRGNVNKRKN